MGIFGTMADIGRGEREKKEDVSRFLSPDEITPDELEDMLRRGIVHFKYKKKDKVNKSGVVIKEGEIRDAWGTKRNDVIAKIPHGGECPPKRVGYITYFDADPKVKDWRVYYPSRIIGVWSKVYDNMDEFQKAYDKYKLELATKPETEPETE